MPRWFHPASGAVTAVSSRTITNGRVWSVIQATRTPSELVRRCTGVMSA